MQSSLAAIAQKGVRVEYVDIALISKDIIANQAASGIKNLTACPATCIGNPTLQSQYLFYFDGIHLTSAGFAIVGEYVVNRLNAPLTFATQGQTGLATTTGFASTMFGRADLFSNQRLSSGSGGPDGAMNLGAGAPAAQGTPYKSGTEVYILAKASAAQSSAGNINLGYTTISEGGTVGLEHRYNRATMVGVAFDYTDATSRLEGGAGKTNVSAYQFGVYGAWNPSNFFAQGLLSYGTQSLTNNRTGVLAGDLTSNSNGRNAAAAAKFGYLFDAGAVRVGPIAGLTYASNRINGYTESGDAALSLAVGSQIAEALVGSAGVQIRFPFAVGRQIVSPYVNITAENDFKGNGRSIQYSATSAPLIVNTWNIDSTPHPVYGRIGGGVSADIASNTAVNVNLSQTFGQGSGNTFGAVGGFSFRF